MHRSTRSVLAALALTWAPIASAQVDLVTTPAGSNLRLERGATFWSTTRTIAELASFYVPSSDAVVATWREESPAGAWTDYYAISLDGSAEPVVRATSYELGFRRVSFDPARELPDFSGTPFPGPGNVYVVQYVSQPLLEYSSTINSLGGEVFDFVEHHAHIVRMSPTVRDLVARQPFVRWIGEYHPEMRVDPELLDELHGGTLGTRRYYVQVFRRGLEEQQTVAEAVAALGGEVHLLVPEGFRFEATMTAETLVQVAALDEVRFIDEWSAPEDDMDVVRIISGANFVETMAGYVGQGVRGEVLDGGCQTTHPDLNTGIEHGSVPDGSHGTCTAGIVFGTGTNNFQARGVMPQGQLIAGYYSSLVGGSRYAHTAELVNPNLSYKCVFQTNSWGSSLLTSSYNTTSAEMDDIIAINDFLICQSQSNAGSTSSRPQAWAKNIVSVGGIRHQNTLTTADDAWNGGGSIGPASDGRLKPDLAHFYDNVLCTDRTGGSGYTSTDYYSSFGGTSAATPITAGHFGLFYEMWFNGDFGNPTGAADVFSARPHFTLAKAALINTATQWTFSGATHDLTRTHQGWGRADVQALYERRTKTFFVDQTDPVTNLNSVTYLVDVPAGEPDLRITLVYRDAMGMVSSSQHRKNDLTLVVNDPAGATYYGNWGLNAAMWSAPGGSANTKDTVENVLVQNPLAGTWSIEVRGDNINTDPVTNTPSTTADFALWVTGVTGAGYCSSPQRYCASKITSQFTTPTIGWVGTASVAANSLVVTMTDALPLKSTIVYYGLASNNVPWHGGVRCAMNPVQRTPVQQTDLSGTASHTVPMDPSMVGVTRYYQWWFRDPQDAFGDGLSDALEVTFCD